MVLLCFRVGSRRSKLNLHCRLCAWLAVLAVVLPLPEVGRTTQAFSGCAGPRKLRQVAAFAQLRAVGQDSGDSDVPLSDADVLAEALALEQSDPAFAWALHMFSEREHGVHTAKDIPIDSLRVFVDQYLDGGIEAPKMANRDLAVRILKLCKSDPGFKGRWVHYVRTEVKNTHVRSRISLYTEDARKLPLAIAEGFLSNEEF